MMKILPTLGLFERLMERVKLCTHILGLSLNHIQFHLERREFRIALSGLAISRGKAQAFAFETGLSWR